MGGGEDSPDPITTISKPNGNLEPPVDLWQQPVAPIKNDDDIGLLLGFRRPSQEPLQLILVFRLIQASLAKASTTFNPELRQKQQKKTKRSKQVGGCVFACVLCCVLWACVFLYFLIFKIFDCFRKQWASFHMTNKKCKPHNGHLSKFEDLTPCVTMENDLNACLKKQKSCWREPFVPLKHLILHACFS